MMERCIKSIPVVRGRRVVGIVARRDLPKALARSDHDIARELEALLSEELGDPSPYRVMVRQGVAELTGPPDPITRKLAGLLTRGIPGVVGVRFPLEGSGEPTTAQRQPIRFISVQCGQGCSGR
jgi:CBS domain-containing protein